MKERLLNLFYFSERNQTADLLKGIAVLFMIQVHITESFLFQRLQQETFGKISFFLGASPAAPVFMIVVGYFLSLKKNLLYYIERGVVLFLCGILLNIGMNFFSLVKYFQSEIIGENPLEYIFGVDILPFAGLSIIIIGLLKEIFYDRYYLYLITGLLVAFFSD
ncbi:MAG: heparan-alpha-glucosaminide N-acetyltransferase domain-containing protein, partial [Ignavibacterium sp.]|nr:heparan-alpha-glucosaminide N-acetyltransferase domain-containing protein [Ignavibacterium sp.]